MNISKIVFETIKNFGFEIDNSALMTPMLETRLFGAEALDSMALVTLIADLEDKLADEIGRPIVLADERAMSKFHSPFRTVATLIAHIERIVNS